MTLPNKIMSRGTLVAGKRVRTNQRFRDLYPRNRALLGTLKNFCTVTTECRVKFDNYKTDTQIDERFLEPC